MKGLLNAKSDTTAQLNSTDEERISVTLINECWVPETVRSAREVIYLESTNSILIRSGGTVMVIDARLDTSVPLMTASIDQDAFVAYDKQNGTLIMGDKKRICFRKEFGGSFLLKSSLKSNCGDLFFLEIPLEEATKLVQISVSDETIMSRRPLLTAFVNSLAEFLSQVPATSQETVMIGVKADLLNELRPLDMNGDNTTDVPSEWSSPIWPLISALAERIRLLVNPEHPYNFEFAPEWKGIDKDIMVSEAARRLTFERWPHMDYRWALPCQMAEAGFYHQPNKAGDDRVLCFACLVCLVCWEPSDEPWSEHERHSPACRFIRNNANPNVPLALTMSALKCFEHGLSPKRTNQIVIGVSSNTEWIAVANRNSSLIHLWRLDRVVQVNQSFMVDVSDSFIALKTGYTTTEPHRRAQRVTWSDDAVNIPSNTISSAEREKKNISSEDRRGTSSQNTGSSLHSASNIISDSSSGSQEVLITALCTVGRPCLIEQSSIGAVAGTTPARCHPTVVVGVAIDDSKIAKTSTEHQAESSSEVTALNSMNSVCGASLAPRIVADNAVGADIEEVQHTSRSTSYHPFILVYQIYENSRSMQEGAVISNRTDDKQQWTIASPTKWVDPSLLDKTASLSSEKMACDTTIDTIDIFANQNSDMEEADFTEAMMLMEGEVDVPEWTGSESAFCNPVDGTGEDTDTWSDASKGTTKYDEKQSTEFIPISYEPPLANVVLVQCFRLPAELDESSMKITSIVAAQNGLSLVAVVNRDEFVPNAVQSAIVIYRLNFNEFITSVQEQPIKAFWDREHRIEQLLLFNSDVFICSRTQMEIISPREHLETAIIRTSEGEVWLVDLNANERLKLCEEKAVYIALTENGKCSVLTTEGKLLLLQVELATGHNAGEEEDEDATVAALLASANLTTQSDTEHDTHSPPMESLSNGEIDEGIISVEPLENADRRGSSLEWQALALQPITMENLSRMWQLTRGDLGSNPSANPSKVVVAVPVQTSCSLFSVIPPPGWTENQIHQVLRKNPQHCLRTDRITRSWHQQPEGGYPRFQVFEIQLQQNMMMSHMNIRLQLHSSCVGCPNIQLSVYRTGPLGPINTGFYDTVRDLLSRNVVSPCVKCRVTFSELENQCELVAGPMHLADYLDVSGTSALIQLAGAAFSRRKFKPKKGGNNTQLFYVALEALGEIVVEQSGPQRNRGKERSIADVGGKAKNSRRREAVATESSSSRGFDRSGKKQSLKTADIASAVAASRGSPYPPSNANWPTNTKSSTSSIANRRGVELIEEISITPISLRRYPSFRERVERRMLIETTLYYNDLLLVAAGARNDSSHTKAVGQLRQHQALDILIWLMENWVVTPTKGHILSLGEVVIRNMNAILMKGFLLSTRSISHKWCSLLISVLRMMKTVKSVTYASLLSSLLNSLKEIIGQLYLIKSAGSLHWLLTLSFAALQMGVSLAGQENCTEAVDSLLACCANTLNVIGVSWKRCRSESFYEKLANNYGICGLPLDLVMFDWPSPVLTLWPRTLNSAGGSSLQPASTMSTSSGPAGAGGSGVYTSPWSQKQTSTKQASLSTVAQKTPPNSLKDSLAVSAFISGLNTQDRMEWLEMFNLNMDDEGDISGSSRSEGSSGSTIGPPPGTGFARFGSLETNMNREGKRRVLLSPSHLSGLLEVEPLTFTCTAASEHVKVENAETGVVTLVSASNKQLGHVATSANGPVPLKPSRGSSSSQASSSEKQQSANIADSYLLKTHLQSLSAKMKDALEQARAKDQLAATSSGQGTMDQIAQGGSITQGSSASTFGVPTTPKTTPFMTPTPLSPSHLSPINSESNLAKVVEESQAADAKKYGLSCVCPTDKIESLKKDSTNLTSNVDENSHTVSTGPVFTPTVAVVPSDLLKPPPLQILSVERMAAGARKFVVLDFGAPVLLTDILIPSCAELASLFVDVWLYGEGIDGQRLTGSSEIGYKSIVLQDIAPTMLIRYMKLTYVGRMVFTAPCRIPVGLFFGHRFFSNWQTYACPHTFSQQSQCMSLIPQNQQQSINLVHLRQLCEDLRCRHQLASAELQQLVREDAREWDVRMAYRECSQLRAQWNIVRGVVNRLENDLLPDDESASLMSWNECCADQLRVVAEGLFSLLNQSSHLLDVRAIAVYTTVHTANAMILQKNNDCDADLKLLKEAMAVSPTVDQITACPLLTLDTAVQHFSLFCTQPMPKLQVDCATWLFHHGAETSWWPQFFSRILTEFFSSPHKKGDHKIFLLLSFLCCHSVKSSSSQSSIILELLQFIDNITKGVTDKEPVEGTEAAAYVVPPDCRLDVTLLCWTLMLTSSAFDVIMGNKRKFDRWAFLAAEYVQHQTSAGERIGDWLPKSNKKTTIAAPPSGYKKTGSSVLVAQSSSSGSNMQQGLYSSKNVVKSQLESLWEQHMQVLETMKANMKMSEALNAKLQKKLEQKKAALTSSPVEIFSIHSTSANGLDSSTNQVSVASADKDDTLTSASFQSSADANQDVDMFEEIGAAKISSLLDAASCTPPHCGSVGSVTPRRRAARQRQYNVRLKLPLEVCLTVAKRLVSLLCDFEDQLPTAGKMIACKMIARICASASHHTIPLVCALDGRVEKLIKIGIDVHCGAQMRQAILSLILDAIEAESRAIAKSFCSTHDAEEDGTFLEGQPKGIPDITAKLERFCTELVGLDYSAIVEHVSKRSEETEDSDGRKSTGAAAEASGVYAFTCCKTSKSFSIANYDSLPNNDELLDCLVDQALELIDPIEIPDCDIDVSLRKVVMNERCREVILNRCGHLRIDSDFSKIFRWIDGVREIEAQCARRASSVQMYVDTCKAGLFPDCHETIIDPTFPVSSSALMACIRNEYILMGQNKGERKTQAAVTSGGSSSPSLPGSPSARDGDVNFDQDLSQEATASDQLYKENQLSPQAVSSVECNNIKNNIECASSIASTSKLHTDSDAVSFCAGLKVKFSKQLLLDHVAKSFMVEMQLLGEDVLVQPSCLAVDERLENHLGLNTHVNCLIADSLSDTLSRHSVRHLTPWRRGNSSRVRLPEDQEIRRKMGHTRETVLSALCKLIKSITPCVSNEFTPSTSNEYVLRVLCFYSEFQNGISASVKRLPIDTNWVFPKEGVEALLSFAIASSDMGEQLWTRIILTLDMAVLSDETIAKYVIESTKFSIFINRFLAQSINKFSESTLVGPGPAVVSALGLLLRHLHESSPLLQLSLATKLQSILRHTLKQGSVACAPYPIEIMTKLFIVLKWSVPKWKQLHQSSIASFAAASIHFARNYFLSQQFIRSSASNNDRLSRTEDACFQQVGPFVGLGADGDTEKAKETSTYDSNDWAKSVKCYQSGGFVDLDVGTAPRELAPNCRRQESLVHMLLEEIANYLSVSNDVVSCMLTEHPGAVEDLLSLLSTCSSANRDLDSLDQWVAVSSADFALVILLELSRQSGEHSMRLLRTTVNTISNFAKNSSTASTPFLSKPVAFAIVRMLSKRSHRRDFVDLGGHLLVARELERCISASTGDCTTPLFAPLVRQLASLSSQVGFGDLAVAPKRPSDVKVDGLYNYAPICQIGSSAMMTHQLSSLLAATPPHRRARNANWSYHFYHNEEWLDLVLTLPYQINLREINIRPHAPTLNTGPSAVQVELCSDVTLNTWSVLGPPINTLGFSKIRIPTTSYTSPVKSIRIYLRRPPDSTNLGLSQILLLGTNCAQVAAPSFGKEFIHWLIILDKICLLDDCSVWEYAPNLPRVLTALLLGRPLNADVYDRVVALLAHIDDAESTPHTIVELITDYFEGRGNVITDSLSWVTDLLYTRCTLPSQDNSSVNQSTVNMVALRQRQLLKGVAGLLSANLLSPSTQEQSCSVTLWAASCVIWKNLFEKSLRKQTIEACSEIARELIPVLCEIAGNKSEAYSDMLSDAAAWLLCSFARVDSSLFYAALLEMRIVDSSLKIRKEPVSGWTMNVMARMCQSETIIEHLISLGLLNQWISTVIQYCRVNLSVTGEHKRMEELVSIVKCISSLCCIGRVVQYLDEEPACAMFRPLISFAIDAVTYYSLAALKWSSKLETATIELLCKCVSFGGEHRERISNIFRDLLQSGDLSGAIQQMVLRCVLADETINVKLLDTVTHTRAFSFDLTNRMMHPLFGCCRRERVQTVSVYSTFRDLLPLSAIAEYKHGKSRTSKGEGASEGGGGANISSPGSESLESQRSEHLLCDIIALRGISALKEDSEHIADYVAYLICDKNNPTAPLPGAMKVGDLIDILRYEGKLHNESSVRSCLSDIITNVSLLDVMEVNTNTNNSAESSSYNDYADGYFMLSLKVNAGLRSEVMHANAAEQAPARDELHESPSRVSTLQHFARVGGLAILAQNLQLYQPSAASKSAINPSTSNGSKDQTAWTWIPNMGVTTGPFGVEALLPYPPFYFNPGPFAPPIASFPMLPAPPPMYDEPPVMYEQDLELIDVPLSQNATEVNQKNKTTYQSAPQVIGSTGFPSLVDGWVPFYNVQNSPSSSSFSLTTGLSPHIVAAFSVLLRLDGYAELLVTHDRRRSKRLLRLAMGVSTCERGLPASANQAPRKVASPNGANNEAQQAGSNENDALALLPLIVLEKLYMNNPSGTETGRVIREKSVQHGVLDILLVCLAHYSHQQHKADRIRPDALLPTPDAVSLTEHLLRSAAQMDAVRADNASMGSGSSFEERAATGYGSNLSSQTQQNFWAKGTGFGSGTTQAQWNVDLHVMKRKLDEETVTHLLQVLASYIYPCRTSHHSPKESSGNSDSRNEITTTLSDDDSAPTCSKEPGSEDGCALNAAVVELLSRSCLFPTVCSYLRNDSVLDISRHVEVYEAVLQLVAALALCPAESDSDDRDSVAVLLSQSDSDVSLLTMLKKLHEWISVYLSKLSTDTEDVTVDGSLPKGSEEGLIRLGPIITRTCKILSRRIGSDTTKTKESRKKLFTLEGRYIDTMKALQFDTIPFFTEGSNVPYHYKSSLSAVGIGGSHGKRTRRLAQEIVTLSNSLPLTSSSSVFVRSAEERLDVMKVLITGPADTPYMNGCFEFDVWFPLDYPISPMHVNLETTGNQTVRFNPNLYNDGKVCLSVLNTWHGRPEERWNPETSSFLQVIVSMQSLILVAEPYFNEPGYERSKCTQAGQQASRDYDANIRQATVRWAMLEMIRRPPPAFADVIKRHFWLKREEITAQIADWIKMMEDQIEEQRGTARSLQSHLASLRRHATALQEEFSRMECPPGLEDEESPAEEHAVKLDSKGSSQNEESKQEVQTTKSRGAVKVLKL